MDALALAVAAALLFTGAAATATRAWKLAASAVFLSLSLALITSAGELTPSVASAALASAVSPMLAPLAAWALVRRSVWVGLAVGGGFIAGPLSTLLYDPFYDLRCLTECDKNPWAIAHLGSTAHLALWTATYIAAATLTVRGLRAPQQLPVLLLALAAWLLAIDPTFAQGSAIFSGIVLLFVGGTTLARTFEGRARVTDLTRVLESTDDIEETLRTSAGDTGLSVSYVLDSGSRSSTGTDSPRADRSTDKSPPTSPVPMAWKPRCTTTPTALTWPP